MLNLLIEAALVWGAVLFYAVSAAWRAAVSEAQARMAAMPARPRLRLAAASTPLRRTLIFTGAWFVLAMMLYFVTSLLVGSGMALVLLFFPGSLLILIGARRTALCFA